MAWRRSASFTGKPKLDLKRMMAHKDETVKANVDGVSFF